MLLWSFPSVTLRDCKSFLGVYNMAGTVSLLGERLHSKFPFRVTSGMFSRSPDSRISHLSESHIFCLEFLIQISQVGVTLRK